MLNPRKRRAIREIAHGATRSETAELVRISSRTLRRWMKEDDFRKELEAVEQEIKRDFETSWHTLYGKVYTAVELALDDPDERLKAVRLFLSREDTIEKNKLERQRIELIKQYGEPAPFDPVALLERIKTDARLRELRQLAIVKENDARKELENM